MTVLNNVIRKARTVVLLVLITAVIGVSALSKYTDFSLKQYIGDKVGQSVSELLNKSTETASSNQPAKNSDIQSLIDSVEIADPGYTHYDREEWENPVKTFDGKRIRNYTLSISVNNESKNDTFKYLDPYTDEYITNTRLIDYDHIIPLNYVNGQIGDTWTTEQKHEYAFNIENGVNVHRSENRSKGAKGPSEYMPPKNQESYAYSWLVVANKYHIPLKQKDMDVIKKVLADTESVSIINPYK